MTSIQTYDTSNGKAIAKAIDKPLDKLDMKTSLSNSKILQAIEGEATPVGMNGAIRSFELDLTMGPKGNQRTD